MRFLLDTHVFLWWVDDAPELTAAARRAIADVNNECYLSLASCWELAIKSSLGKLQLAMPIERFVSEHLAANGFTLLNIELHHAAKIEKLPFHHRDPFDRLLISQAMTEKLTIVSADRVFAHYGVKILW
ncbi:MAG: type II toxin-antitoxin system VapC family toxin [Candidatus Riflebacteria bacterium]|nr:type II toxin-antitoxin system VapC family toxin [Candidatus Riflebacteria bacterium]